MGVSDSDHIPLTNESPEVSSEDVHSPGPAFSYIARRRSSVSSVAGSVRNRNESPYPLPGLSSNGGFTALTRRRSSVTPHLPHLPQSPAAARSKLSSLLTRASSRIVNAGHRKDASEDDEAESKDEEAFDAQQHVEGEDVLILNNIDEEQEEPPRLLSGPEIPLKSSRTSSPYLPIPPSSNASAPAEFITDRKPLIHLEIPNFVSRTPSKVSTGSTSSLMSGGSSRNRDGSASLNEGDGESIKKGENENHLSKNGAYAGKRKSRIGKANEIKLAGNSLYLFSPTNPLRKSLRTILVNFEPFIFFLIMLNLVILAFYSYPIRGQSNGTENITSSERDHFGVVWMDWVLLLIFIIYTLEIVCRVIVHGFIFGGTLTNPCDEAPRKNSFLRHTKSAEGPKRTSPKGTESDCTPGTNSSPNSGPTPKSSANNRFMQSVCPVPVTEPSNFVNTSTSGTPTAAPASMPARQNASTKTVSQMTTTAYLRHSFNRLDLVAVLSFWIYIILATKWRADSGNLLEQSGNTDPGTSTSWAPQGLGIEHLRVLRALSALRTVRLVVISQGSETILKSLKKSAPLLLNVVYFLCFFFLVFGVIGLQAFGGSLSRRCVETSTNIVVQPPTFCGGYYTNSSVPPFTATATPYIDSKTLRATTTSPPKGHLCKIGQICVEPAALSALRSNDPTQVRTRDNLTTFDTIFSAVIIIFITATQDGWSGIMYDVMDAETSFAAAYFIVIIVIMSFWLVNLFVAVITEMFSLVRGSDGRGSFTGKTSPRNWLFEDVEKTGAPTPLIVPNTLNNQRTNSLGSRSSSRSIKSLGSFGTYREFQTLAIPLSPTSSRSEKFKQMFVYCVSRSKWVWILLIVADITVMSWNTYGFDPVDWAERLAFADIMELAFTFLFLVEIILRFLAALFSLPSASTSLRNALQLFFQFRRNKFDAFLVAATCSMQIFKGLLVPTGFYMYLSVFQIARSWRVVIAVKRIRFLLYRAIGSLRGLTNLVVFMIMYLLISAVIAMQLFGGDLPVLDDQGNPIYLRFDKLNESWLALYTILTGEDWSTVLYHVMVFHPSVWIAAVFIILFFCFSNFVLLNMIIAVIVENFETLEAEKQRKQIAAFIAKSEGKKGRRKDVISKWNVYRYLKPNPRMVQVETLPSSMWLQTQTELVREFLEDRSDAIYDTEKLQLKKRPSVDEFRHQTYEKFSAIRSLFKRKKKTDSDRVGVPLPNSSMNPTQNAPFEISFSDMADSNTKDFTVLNGARSPGQQREMEDEQEREAAAETFLIAHPNYARALFCLHPTNRFRKFCKSLVSSDLPTEHTNNVPRSNWREEMVHRRHRAYRICFSGLMFLSITATIITAALNTPAYAKAQLHLPEIERSYFFLYSDIFFTVIFTLEFLVKIFADGFLFTPKAYILNSWNALDFFVLLTMYTGLFANTKHSTGIARALRAAQALRALRLINQFQSIKETFHAILIAGFPRILEAAVLSILLIVPFAVYLKIILAGQFYGCNDDSVAVASECLGEFVSNTADFLAPRVWQNPQSFNFDAFRSSLLILYENVSNEGWIDVMVSGMQANGNLMQPKWGSSWWNAIIFCIFAFIACLFVRSLFVAVVVANFTTRKGTAYLTADQKRWIDLTKLLRQIQPPLNLKRRPVNRIQAWCFDNARDKRGWMSRFMTFAAVVNVLLFITEHHTEPDWLSQAQLLGYFIIAMLYILEFAIRITGLGLRPFLRNRWNIYDFIVMVGAVISSIGSLAGKNSGWIIQMQKVFLVAITFKLVQKWDNLQQLFKTMRASLGSISNLLIVWFIILITYAIMCEQIFGLTSYGTHGSDHVNFRDIATSLLSLIRFSTGEAWNYVMHDFTVEVPDCIDTPANFLLSDCGSTAWAYVLFLSFNVVSMYIFANMFIVVVLDNFSYCYQIAGSFSLFTRQEIRDFKKAWASIDVNSTGYIQSKDFPAFFSKLTGPFATRIYPPELSIHNLIGESCVYVNSCPTSCRRASTSERNGRYLDQYQVDVTRLAELLSTMDVNLTRKRRKAYNFLYWEALCSEEPRGLPFSKMLGIFSYQLVNIDNALQIGDLLKRKEKVERVDDLVNVDRVRGIFQTFVLSRKFQKHRAETAALAEARQEEGIPRIVVNQPSHPASPTHALLPLHTPISLRPRNHLESQYPYGGSPKGDDSLTNDVGYFNAKCSLPPNRNAHRPLEVVPGIPKNSIYLQPLPTTSNDRPLFPSVETDADNMDEATVNSVLSALNNSQWHAIVEGPAPSPLPTCPPTSPRRSSNPLQRRQK